LFTVGLIVVFAYVVYSSQEMPLQAKMYPMTIGTIALMLLIWQLAREILPAKTEESRETGADMDFTEEESTPGGKKRTLELFGWVYGFGLALWLIGFFVAIPVMVFLYLLRQRESWVISLSFPTVAGLSTWLLFNNLLHLPFPPGVLFELLGIEL
jgi:hypothetical protein